jgi:hypothetical protein
MSQIKTWFVHYFIGDIKHKFGVIAESSTEAQQKVIEYFAEHMIDVEVIGAVQKYVDDGTPMLPSDSNVIVVDFKNKTRVRFTKVSRAQ